MYTKLVFYINEVEITFCSHEIVKIAMDEVARHSHTPVIDLPIISNYQSLGNRLQIQFDKFSRTILGLYETKYGLKYGILKEFLEEIHEICIKDPGMIPYLLIDKWGGLLNHIKAKKKTDQAPKNFLNKLHTKTFLPVPPSINSVNTIKKWLSLAKHLSDIQWITPVIGWWILIAGRLIRIHNDPDNREQQKKPEHFYVTDHGSMKDVHRQTESITALHSLFDRSGYNWAIFDFYHKFYKKLDERERKLVKENFINLLNNVDITDEEYMEVLLVSLGCPQSTRQRIRDEGKLQFPMAGEVGCQETETKSLINEPDCYRIRNERYYEYCKVFELTLERVRYQAEVRLATYVQKITPETLTVFRTQVEQVLSPQDAEIYMECMLLTYLNKEISRGDRKMLFRSTTSYGDTNSGSTYHAFEKAFASYLCKQNHYTEAELAGIMRAILRGEDIQVDDTPFLPNLVGAWFIAEASRNPSSVLSGLMLLDMIESGIVLLDKSGNNWYTWRNALIHPLKGTSVGKVQDLYSSHTNIDRFGGCHPMVHNGSVGDTKKELCERGKLSIVRQKEGSLYLHWLAGQIPDKFPGYSHKLVRAGEQGSKVQVQSISYGEINQEIINKKRADHKKKIEKLQGTIRVKQSKDPATDVSKQEKEIIREHGQEHTIHRLQLKQCIKDKIIEPLIRSRLATLEHIPQKEVDDKVNDASFDAKEYKPVRPRHEQVEDQNPTSVYINGLLPTISTEDIETFDAERAEFLEGTPMQRISLANSSHGMFRHSSPPVPLKPPTQKGKEKVDSGEENGVPFNRCSS